MADSSIPEFFKKSRQERLAAVADFAGLSKDELDVLWSGDGGMPFERAETMVENTIGTFGLPLGVATNFCINSRDHLVPMAIEEPSVIAAASKGAKTARVMGGFEASADPSYSTGQIQVLDCNMPRAVQAIQDSADRIISIANSQSRTLSGMGRGARDVGCRIVDAPSGSMLIVEIGIDAGDAMGANITNTMCEAVSPLIEEVTGGRALLRILSNYSTRRLARARAVFARDAVGGEKIVDDMVLAFEFADCDVYRAVTHNKGVMNGIISVANAVGQDSRAIEAAAHAYAARSGRYRSLTRWAKDGEGNLVGEIEIPLPVGIIGGVVKVHPVARVCSKILGVSSAQDLACVMVSAGLAQNYSAMRALATDGIQKGHMGLHARNVAAAAGATPDQIERIARMMADEGNITVGRAKELLSSLKK